MSSTRFDAEARQGLALVSPPLIYAVLMLAAPLITILAYSFFKDGYLEVIREFTLENYKAVWSDPIFHKVMARSLGVAFAVTLTTVLLAYTLSMACLSTRKSTLSPKVHRWINRLVSASLSLSVGASVWIISIQSPEHFQHMFLASMSGVLVLLFILMENHLVHRTGVEVSMALHERLNVAKKRR